MILFILGSKRQPLTICCLRIQTQAVKLEKKGYNQYKMFLIFASTVQVGKGMGESRGKL